MNALSYQDLLLLAIAILAPMSCVGTVVYMIVSDSRAEAASLRAATKAFTKLLSEHRNPV
jgi:hypothetical protein